MVALFVLATILLFVIADAIVVHLRKGETPVEAKPTLRPESMPAGLFVDARHSWVALEPDGRVRVGLDGLARKLVGTIDEVRFVAQGKRLARGETLMWVRAGEVEIPVASPVTGVVEATQVPAADANGTDAAAWFVSLLPERLGFEVRAWRVAEEAAVWMKAEYRRLSEALVRTRAATANAMPDGGEPADGFIRHLDAKSRDEILRGFLTREG
ncbi:MAG: hypothetical protein HY905_08980 [Deltaproteobacteria bacterium]|nr:hypothetical protein [Deltaproteobacteria bacterium]